MQPMERRKFPKNWVRHYRTIADISAVKLGEQVGVEGPHITMIETGERGLSVDLAKKIAAVFNCHYTEIIDGPGQIVGSLSEEEQEALDLFKKLPEREQYKILGVLEEKIHTQHAQEEKK